MRELLEILAEQRRATTPLALATIVRTSGSSYRKAGARMLVRADGTTLGTLSGGCIEEEVAALAMTVLTNGEPRLCRIDTLRRFGCHGAIEIFIERLEPRNAFLDYVRACLNQRRPAEVTVVFENAPKLGSFAASQVEDEAFRETIQPPVRVVIVGDGVDTDALLHFGARLGWELLVFQRVEELPSLPCIDSRTAAVVKQHHFGRDFAALQRLLLEPFGYVGLLGSRRRRGDLLHALVAEGFLPPGSAMKRFHSPIGLDLGAETPDEIALAIVAEIQAAMAGGEGGFLRGPIHHAAMA